MDIWITRMELLHAGKRCLTIDKFCAGGECAISSVQPLWVGKEGAMDGCSPQHTVQEC